MQGYLKRKLTSEINAHLGHFPVVAILGPRQCGKSTLAKHIISTKPESVYLDLESDEDLTKLSNPGAYFKLHQNKFICLDEVQRAPEIFRTLRPIIDNRGQSGQFLVLGSSSPELLQQSAESLAGRIAYLELTPFILGEVLGTAATEVADLAPLWLRGGFPSSYLTESDRMSHAWRKNYIRTFLDRDLGVLGLRIPSRSVERLWKMCAQVHGALLNTSMFAASMGVSSHTIRHYMSVLEDTFLLKLLPPLETNIKKRLVKSPKLYLRDSGILHALLGIQTMDDLFSNPIYGSSWEGFAIETITAAMPDWEASFYRTSAGAELDLVLDKGAHRISIECKASNAPKVTKGFWNAVNDIQPDRTYVISPVKEPFPLDENIMVCSLAHFLEKETDVFL